MNTDYIEVRRTTTTPRSWRRLWRQGKKEEYRLIPVSHYPFARAYREAVKANTAAWVVAPLIHLPKDKVRAVIELAIWEAAGATLAYLESQTHAWALQRRAEDLGEGHLYTATLDAARAQRMLAEELDVEVTEACDRIYAVCHDVVVCRDRLWAEDRAWGALRQADRRGAYSAYVPPATTQDLADRVSGLRDGLRRIGAVA